MTVPTTGMAVHGPAGPQAAQVDQFAWFLYAVSAAVWVLVMAFLLYAALHRRRAGRQVREGPAAERRMVTAVGAATAVTLAILFTFLWLSFTTGRAMSALWSPDALQIELIGHQWWWEVRYPNPDPSRAVVTANEMHVPVGRTVVVKTRSRDVIHSLWLPALGARRDLVPGYEGTATFRADRPGLYRGQCAEYCGHQHAHMALLVVAVPPEQFDEWLVGQTRPAPTPATDRARRGREVFESSSCALCHTIRGTVANGRVGPELTHLASRSTLAAGTLPNVRGHLAGWIADPQQAKPGVRMPGHALPPDDLQALLDYLETLR